MSEARCLADPSFRALSGRLKSTARRHKSNKDSLFSRRGVACGVLSQLAFCNKDNSDAMASTPGQFSIQRNNHFAEMCSSTAEGSYFRPIDLCITQL